MLRLGATWWDSEQRFLLVQGYEAHSWYEYNAVESLREREPTLRERRWVKVVWDDQAGLWLLDCDTTMDGILDEENLVPLDAGKISLARNMQERCAILKDMGANIIRTSKTVADSPLF